MRPAIRNIILGHRSVILPPSVVQSGMIMHLDAGNTLSYSGTGNSWFDLSGNNANATLTDITFDSANKGLDFNGTTSFASIPSSSINSFERTNSFSFSSWVRPTEIRTGTSIAKNDVNNRGYAFLLDTSGRLTFALRNTAATNDLLVTSPNDSYVANGFINISCSYFGTSLSSGVALYINGMQTPLVVVRDGLTQTISNSIPATLGKFGSNILYFIGTQFIQQTYNRALSPAEHLQNFNANRARFGL